MGKLNFESRGKHYLHVGEDLTQAALEGVKGLLNRGRMLRIHNENTCNSRPCEFLLATSVILTEFIFFCGPRRENAGKTARLKFRQKLAQVMLAANNLLR